MDSGVAQRMGTGSDAGRFAGMREARIHWLTEAGWSCPLAALVACAEVPWPDGGKFTSEVWVRLANLQGAYGAASSVGSPNPEAARAAVQSYLRLAEAVGAVSWASLLRRTLAEARSELRGLKAAAGQTDNGLVPLGANLARLEELRERLEAGLPVAQAAAHAYLAVPWLDGVQVTPELERFLSERTPIGAAASAAEVRQELEQLREAAMDGDSPDYVAATDLLLAGLPVEDDDDAPTQDGDDALAGLMDRPEYATAVSWFADTDASWVASHAQQRSWDERRRIGVDYSATVPRSLFDPSAFVYQMMAEEARVGSGAQTLAEAVAFAARRKSGRLHRALSTVPIETSSAFGERLVEQVAETLTFCDTRMQTILERRLLAERPETLESLGQAMGVTRERVRQLQKAVEQSLAIPRPAVEQAGSLLRSALGDRVERSEFAAALQRLVPGDDARASVRIARALVTKASGYQWRGDVAVSTAVLQQRKRFMQTIDKHTDERGFVNESMLWSESAAGEGVREGLLAESGAVRICGYLMRRDSQKCRVYAALTSIGKPATVGELNEALGEFAFEHVGNVLSAAEDIVKATKDGWALTEWTDRPYEGIANEIAYRISRDGGVTSVEGLMTELPERYGVSTHSIGMYLGTPRFEVKHGEVRLASRMRSNHTPLERLDSVVAIGNRPVFAVGMEERYLSGYSIPIPPAVAEFLGVTIGESELIPVAYPKGCEDVSVIWNAHAVSGPSMGRVREALEKLSVSDGETFYIRLNKMGLSFLDVLPPDAREIPKASTTDDGTEASVDAVIERMRSRRQL